MKKRMPTAKLKLWDEFGTPIGKKKAPIDELRKDLEDWLRKFE